MVQRRKRFWLHRTRQGGDKPYAIILDTVKGAGIPEVAETVMNHSYTVDDDRFRRYMAGLEAQLQELEG